DTQLLIVGREFCNGTVGDRYQELFNADQGALCAEFYDLPGAGRGDLLYLFIFAKGRLPRCDLLKSAIAVDSARSASSAVQVRQRTSNCSLSCKCHNSLPPRWLTGFPLPKSIN